MTQTLALAQQTLLSPFDLTTGDVDRVLARIGDMRGVSGADLYFQLTRAQSWSLEEGIVKTGSFSIDQGVGVRAISGDKTAFAYSDDVSLRSLMEAADTVRAIGAVGGAASKPIRVGRPLGTLSTGRGKRIPLARTHLLYDTQDPIAAMDSAAKVELLNRIERLARAQDPRITQVMASVAAEHEVILVARLDGLRAADIRPLVRVNVTVIAEQTVGAQVRRETGFAAGGGRLGLEVFDEDSLLGYVRTAVHAALTNLESRPAPAGPMSVVLGPGWPGVLLHEAVGHGLEGDFNRKGSSAFAGRIGQRVAAKGVTVLDDGTLPRRRGSLNIDDEGHPTQCNVLIEDGVLRGYLQDSLNARLMGVAPTGNGRRESYAHTVLPRMTNTYMLAGHTDPAEIIASLDRGLYAVNFDGGQVDITSGKYVFSASQAYWVEKGRIQYPVKGATIIGSGPESLRRVSMIGNDLLLDTGVGVCGKEGQSVPVGVGQPTLRVEGLTVGGTA